MTRLEVHVTPGARTDRVGGTHGGALAVRTRARAVDGAANQAVIDLLADALGVASARIDIVRGRRSRRKFIAIDADVDGEVERLLGVQ